MAAPIDLSGKTFGTLRVIRRVENTDQGKARWRCKCECGETADIVGASLLRGLTTSCGCKKRKTGEGCRFFKHGRSGVHSGTYTIWKGMKARCSNEKLPHYKNYGGRGISVCLRWDKFENFLADMGERPAGLSLDRINNDGNYEPGNCRWATPLEQSHNSRRPTWLTARGKTQNLSEWARELGVDVPTLLERLEKWPLEKALSTPKKTYWVRRGQPRIT